MIKSRIKYYLDKNNMTQRELAEKTGMTETSISRYVSGIRIPRATECIEIAKVLGCKAEDLFIKVDEESAKEPVCEWIPCSERLPDDGTYLCTFDGDLCGINESFTGMCTVTDGAWDEWGVLAWMPLPEPYKEGGCDD